MPSRTTMRLGATVLATGALLCAAPLAAQAAEPPAPTPSTSPTPTGAPGPSADHDGTAAQQRQVRALTDRIVALQAAADATGRTAQEVNERYLDARADADAARDTLEDATATARAAVAKAVESRARAAGVAAQLSRTDMGTLPLNLMLNHASADRVLGGLSSAGQLSDQSQLLYRQAKDDQAAAEHLQAVQAERDRAATAAARKAGVAYDRAKHEAAAAKRAVQDAERQQAVLLQRIAGEDVTAVGDVCGQLQGAASVCSPAAAPASSAGGSIGERVVAFARSQIGEPYVFAAAGPDAWDCSGLTMGAWESVGVPIGIHSATAQYRTARDAGELVPVADAEPGDLLFYTGGGGDMYHITVYAGGGDMVEAPYPGATVREVPVRTNDLLGQAAHIR